MVFSHVIINGHGCLKISSICFSQTISHRLRWKTNVTWQMIVKISVTDDEEESMSISTLSLHRLSIWRKTPSFSFIVFARIGTSRCVFSQWSSMSPFIHSFSMTLLRHLFNVRQSNVLLNWIDLEIGLLYTSLSEEKRNPSSARKLGLASRQFFSLL